MYEPHSCQKQAAMTLTLKYQYRFASDAMLVLMACIIGQAEKQNIRLGGSKFYSPGTCPADFKYLEYGEHVLSKAP